MTDEASGARGLRTSEVEPFRAERTRKDMILRTALRKKRASPKIKKLRKRGRLL